MILKLILQLKKFKLIILKVKTVKFYFIDFKNLKKKNKNL